MNRAVSHLATRRALRGLVTNGRFLKEERWDKGAIRKGLWEGVSFGRKGVARVFIMQIHVASPFWYGIERDVTLPSWCWTSNVETIIRSRIKSRFGMAFSTNDTTLCL